MHWDGPEESGLTILAERYILSIVVPMGRSLEKEIQDKQQFKEDVYRNIDDPELINAMNIELTNEDTNEGIYRIIYGIAHCWEIVTNRLGLPLLTPWTLESTRGDKNLTFLLGEPRTLLPIRVNFDGEVSIHFCKEELVFGLLIVLEDVEEDITLSMRDIYDNFRADLEIKYFLANYQTNTNRKYEAKTKYGIITFDTIDVITGVITTCKWINEDPHKYIFDIRDNGVLVTF